MYTATRQPKRPSGADYLEAVRQEREDRGVPDDLAVKRITVGGVPVFIRRLTDEARASLYRWMERHRRPPVALAAKLFTLSVCDANGDLLYSIDEGPNVAKAIPPLKLAAVADAVARLNGFGV